MPEETASGEVDRSVDMVAIVTKDTEFTGCTRFPDDDQLQAVGTKINCLKMQVLSKNGFGSGGEMIIMHL